MRENCITHFDMVSLQRNYLYNLSIRPVIYHGAIKCRPINRACQVAYSPIYRALLFRQAIYRLSDVAIRKNDLINFTTHC